METRRTFGKADTHGVLERFRADIRTSSDGCGWSSVYASVQREKPFVGTFEPIDDDLLVLLRSGPVSTSFCSAGHAVTRTVPEGSVFFLPAGHACEVGLNRSLDSLHIYLRSHLFEGDRTILSPMLFEDDPILRYLAHAIERAMGEKSPGSGLFIEPIARALATRIADLCRRNESWHLQTKGLRQHQVRQLRDFVEANLDREIRLDAMASACGLGTKSFVRAFKATTGQSPSKYVTATRIERAKQLIEQHRDGLAEIALRCGFSHQEHLTRVFRRLTGQTPGRYRRSVA